jgi:hypothetical protein
MAHSHERVSIKVLRGACTHAMCAVWRLPPGGLIDSHIHFVLRITIPFSDPVFLSAAASRAFFVCVQTN